MGQPNLETLLDWEGDAEDLARVGEQWCMMLRIEDRPDLTVRLIRDYTQRAILSRPRREGKTAIYGWEHLVRLIGARLLLRDGWPLQKIADEFTIRSTAEVRELLPVLRPLKTELRPPATSRISTDPALDALRAIRSRSAESEGNPRVRRERPKMLTEAPPITDRLTRRQDLSASLRELGENAAEVPSQNYTRLEITAGVELHIEVARLRSLGRTDAHAIANAVLACLLDPRIRREDKSE